MKLRFSVTKDGKEIAFKIAEVEKEGDITAAVHDVFAQARSAHPSPLWDCEIQLRRV